MASICSFALRLPERNSRRIRESSTLASSSKLPCSSTLFSSLRSNCPRISMPFACSLMSGKSISTSLKKRLTARIARIVLRRSVKSPRSSTAPRSAFARDSRMSKTPPMGGEEKAERRTASSVSRRSSSTSAKSPDGRTARAFSLPRTEPAFASSIARILSYSSVSSVSFSIHNLSLLLHAAEIMAARHILALKLLQIFLLLLDERA